MDSRAFEGSAPRVAGRLRARHARGGDDRCSGQQRDRHRRAELACHTDVGEVPRRERRRQHFGCGACLRPGHRAQAAGCQHSPHQQLLGQWGLQSGSQGRHGAGRSRGHPARVCRWQQRPTRRQHADVPAVYDNRGIVSVLASDQNDAGASFTNYGLGSVDIAAPGVSTLSTVPTGSCALCDRSGYKLLSGTSMATPHVTGVLAGLFVQNPELSSIQARDVVSIPVATML